MSFSLGEIAAIDAIVYTHSNNKKLIARVEEERRLIQQEHESDAAPEDE